MPRRRFDNDDDFDDRPRARPRRFDDEDDDDDPPPPRHRHKANDNTSLIIGMAFGAAFLFTVLGIGGYFAFRSMKPAGPPPPQFAANPQVGMGNAPQPVFVPPGVPQDVIPNEIATECIISNLRFEAAFGGRTALAFDYEFRGGRPFGGDRFVVIVTEPGRAPTQVNLHGFMNAKDKVAIERIGGIGNYASGTTVYLAKGLGSTKRISNVLRVP